MKDNFNPRSKESVQAWLADWVAGELVLDPKMVAAGKAFLGYGMNSVQAMMLVGDLEDALGLRLSPTLVWDYPSIETLAEYVVAKASMSRSHGAPTANGDGKLSRLKPSEEAPAASLRDSQTLLARLDELSEAEMDSLLQDYLTGSRESA